MGPGTYLIQVELSNLTALDASRIALELRNVFPEIVGKLACNPNIGEVRVLLPRAVKDSATTSQK